VLRNKIVFFTQLLNETYIVWHVVMLVLSVFIYSFIHLVVCLTTGTKPLPKRAVHIVQSRASTFK